MLASYGVTRANDTSLQARARSDFHARPENGILDVRAVSYTTIGAEGSKAFDSRARCDSGIHCARRRPLVRAEVRRSPRPLFDMPMDL